MARKKKQSNPAPESAAASEHATEGESKRKVVDLPGMVGDGVEKPVYPELDKAVLDYVKSRDLRMKHGIDEKAHKHLIVAFMESKKLGSYEVDDMVVIRKPKDETASIKVVSKSDYEGDSGGEEGEE